MTPQPRTPGGTGQSGGSRDRRPDEFTTLAVAARMSGAVMPVLLFTVLRLNTDDTLSRIYSSRPDEYPIGGRKSRGADLSPDWIRLCVHQQLPYVGNTVEDVRRAFADHELIERLGCGSFINAPVVDNGRTIATVCLLAGPGSFGDDEVAAAQLIANGSAYGVVTG